MSTYKQNGEYELQQLDLIVGNNTLDIRDIFVDVTLYESINDPCMSGSVSFVDSNGLYSQYALGHGETVAITFKTSGSGNEIQYQGYVYKATPAAKVSEKSHGMVLYFISREYMNNLSQRVPNAFKTGVDEIVRNVHGRVAETKPIDIESTTNIESIISPNFQPFQLITKLCRRAKGLTGGFGFVHYENNKRWRFVSMDTLVNQQTTNAYRYKPGGIYEDATKKEQEQFSAIQDYSITDFDNIIHQHNDGLMGATCVNLDLMNKSVFEQTYKETEESTSSLAQYPVPTSRHVPEGYEARREMFAVDKDQPFVESRFTNLMKIMRYQKFGVNIEIFGDSNNKVGDVVECELPIWSSSSNQPSSTQPDYFSGRCLVYELKHNLKKSGYMQTMKLVKDSYEERIE